MISWDDVDCTETMGKHFVERLGAEVFIREHEIENWKEDPKGLHKAIKITSLNGPPRYSLGSFYPSR